MECISQSFYGTPDKERTPNNGKLQHACSNPHRIFSLSPRPVPARPH